MTNLFFDIECANNFDSRADAFFTMKLEEKLVSDAKKPLTEILKPFSPSRRGLGKPAVSKQKDS